MEIRVVSEQSAAVISEDYVRVETWCDPEQDTVTLATIERVIHKARPKPASPRLLIKTLVQRARMSVDEALVLAKSYAERKQIPLVLTAAPMLPAHRQDAPR